MNGVSRRPIPVTSITARAAFAQQQREPESIRTRILNVG
jgi:hypothetical protein